MSDVADVAAALVSVLYVTSAITLCVVGLPQLLALLRGQLRGWPYQDFRLMTAWVFLATAVALVWRGIVYADFAYADQLWLGTIQTRWPIEVAVAVFAQSGYGYAAGLYIRYRRRAHR